MTEPATLAEELELVLSTLRAGVRRSETEHVVGYWVGKIIRLDIKGEVSEKA